MTNSISGDGNSQNNVKRITNLKEFQAANPEVKNSKQINSIFEQLDTNKDGILQREEGSLIFLSNGGVYAEDKNGKAYMAVTENGHLYKYDDKGNREYINTEKPKYVVSPKRTIVAKYDEEGNLHTPFTPGDSFTGTIDRLGLNSSDPEILKAMEKANPEAAKRKKFVLEDDNNQGYQVKIPKEILDNYEIKTYNLSVRLYKKPEGEKAEDAREKANAEFADKLEKSEWKQQEVKFTGPDPFKPVAPVEGNAESKGKRNPYEAIAPFAEEAVKTVKEKGEKQQEVKSEDKAPVETKTKKQIRAEKAEAKKLEAQKQAEAKALEAQKKAEEQKIAKQRKAEVAELKAKQKAEEQRIAEERKTAAAEAKARKEAEAKELRAKQRAEEQRIAEERKAAAAEAKAKKEAEAERIKAEKADAAKKAAEAKKAAAVKQSKTDKASAAVVNEEFRTKMKEMKTGIVFTPKYNINEKGQLNREAYNNTVNIRTSDIARIHPREFNPKLGKDGYYHRGPAIAKVADTLTPHYEKMAKELSIEVAIYQDLAKKSSLTDGEKIFMQECEQNMLKFMNAK